MLSSPRTFPPFAAASRVNISWRRSSMITHPFFSLLPCSSLQQHQQQQRASPRQQQQLIQKLIWTEIGPNLSEAHKDAISKLPHKMTKRCKAVMKHIICLPPPHQDGDNDLSELLSKWVKIMKPRRVDWLSILREMRRLEHPLMLKVMEFALEEESFEVDIRDYTKIIDAYAKQNRLQDAENAVRAMKRRGFTCDQVTITVLVHMYSKAGDVMHAQQMFQEMKLLGLPLDKRAYGAMIMAYIRAGMLGQGESLMREMQVQEDIFAGREVYKALLRAYSTMGDTEGAQRVFNAIQFAGIVPDVRLCTLLLNAYSVAGQTDKARSVLENLRIAGLKPSDKCVRVMLNAYEKVNDVDRAVALVLDLEKDGFKVGKETTELLVKWFQRLGVVDEAGWEVMCQLTT